MEIKIKCELILNRDGIVKLRHELAAKSGNPLEDTAIFGFSFDMSPKDSKTVCDELPLWILNRFQLEVKGACAGLDERLSSRLGLQGKEERKKA